MDRLLTQLQTFFLTIHALIGATGLALLLFVTALSFGFIYTVCCAYRLSEFSMNVITSADWRAMLLHNGQVLAEYLTPNSKSQ